MADEVEQEAGGAGNWSLLGFDYQIDVSVWLALDVMVAAKLASDMVLEHISEEDIEADVEELEPGPVADAVCMRSGYRLIVQAKRRTGNAWTEARYITLLKHGTRRQSAKARLEADPAARYLLVTSAALNAPVSKIGVRKAGSWPAPVKVSEKIAAVGVGLAGRLAVIGSQDDERLVSDIKELLLERFRVPRARWEEALDELRKAAWNRMRGAQGGRWTREEVEAVLAAHEAYVIAGSERDDYVMPTNWGDLEQALSKHHAIMIIGQSGSGKTATAEALWHDRKAAIPDLKRVHITHGPDQLWNDNTQPPVLYDIEDPWGRFKFEPDSRPWNDQLSRAFQSARHDRLFVATSRTDVATSSSAIDSVQRWRMPLDAENYGRAERQRLYRNLLEGLSPELRAFAHEHEHVVLQQLGLPLELRKFFDALPGLDREGIAKNAAAAISTAIEQAHRNSIERTVVDQIEARDAVKAAGIVWALIKPHGRLSADVLRSVEDPLVDADPTLEDKIGAFVNSFITARNLRQGADGSLAYYHGKVEAGIEAALAARPQPVRRALRNLVSALLARDEETGGSWGVDTAADIMRQSQRIADLTPRLARGDQDRVDSYVEGKLDSEGRELDQAVTLAAAIGSPRSNLSEFARWLDHRPDRSFPGMIHWGRPERDATWNKRIRDDPAVRTMAERFVRTVLPTDHTSFPMTFSSDLVKLVGDLTDAYVDAAKASVFYGFITNDDVIAAGALTDVDRFEEVIDLAVVALTPSDAELEAAERDRLRIYNDEVSEDYADHLADNDDGMTARSYVEAYIERRRADGDWRKVSNHRHIEILRPHWLRLIVRDPVVAPLPEEIEAAVALAYGTDDEDDMWALVTKNWDERYVGPLLNRMTEGADQSAVRRSALDCFIDHLPDRIGDVFERLSQSGNFLRLAQFASDLAHRASKRGHDAKDRGDAALKFIAELPAPWREVADAETALLDGQSPTLSEEAITAIASIAEPTEEIRATRVSLAQHVSIDAAEDVRWTLAHSKDHDAAVAAIDVAIGYAMTEDIEGALQHRFAHVAARALTALAEPLAAPLPSPLLALVERTSSPIRKALLAQLAAKPHADHLPTLLKLTEDDWQRWSPQQNDDENFPIARDAVLAITNLEAVPTDLLDEFLKRARTTEDLGLMFRMLACVVRHGGEERQRAVVEMSRKGKRVVVGRAAAHALLDQVDNLTEKTAASISDAMVLNLPAMIADYHVWTVGLTASADRIDALADALATSDDRRVFLALLAFARRDRDPDHGTSVAARLPEGHPARAWAMGEDVKITREMLIDLGDASSVKEAFSWMKSKE